MFTKVLNNKFFSILLSVLIAIGLWFYVTGVYNPDTSEVFKGVQVVVEYKGSVPDKMGLVPTDTTIATVDVKVNGPRVLLATMTKDKIVAKADLTAVNKTGSYQIPVEITLPSDQLNLVSKDPQNIPLNFDKKATVQVPVKVNITGKINDNLLVGSVSSAPQEITVTGPESVLKTIKYALADVDVTNITASKETKTSFMLVNDKLKQVKMASITTDFDTVNVSIPILFNKKIPLSVELINTSGGNDSKYAEVKIAPESISLAGSEEVLNEINNINIGQIDTSKIVKNTTQTFDLVLPNNVNNVNDIKSAKVTVTFKDIITNSLTVNNITIRNAPANKKVTALTTSVSVKVRGLSADISSLTGSQINAVIDLEGAAIAKGNLTVPLTFELPKGINAGVVGSYSAIISVK